MPYIASKVSQFKSDFLNISHSSYNPLYRLRYVLGKLENNVLSKTGLPLKGSDFIFNLQIEHILPQTSKNGIMPSEFEDEDDYKASVRKLGNVTLLESTINQAVNNFNDLGSNWFEKKQKEYVKSVVVTTNLLHHEFSIGKNTAINKFKIDYNYTFDGWGKQSIANRQKIFLELAFESWKFNDKRIDQIDVSESDDKENER